MEGVQGEGGVTPATPEYLLGLRALFATRKNCCCSWMACSADIYRTGRFPKLSADFGKMFPVAKNFCPTAFRWPSRSAGDFPIGAFWVRAP